MLPRQLSLANKDSNVSSSVEALVSPTPPSYEEATAGIKSLSSTNAFGDVLLGFGTIWAIHTCTCVIHNSAIQYGTIVDYTYVKCYTHSS